MQERSDVASIIHKGLVGIFTWLGGLTLSDFSSFMAGLSYACGALWFLTQTYFLWQDKKRKDREREKE